MCRFAATPCAHIIVIGRGLIQKDCASAIPQHIGRIWRRKKELTLRCRKPQGSRACKGDGAAKRPMLDFVFRPAAQGQRPAFW